MTGAVDREQIGHHRGVHAHEPPVDRSVTPPEVLLDDTVHPCPYLSGEEARLPLRLPLGMLDREALDDRLEAGDRRHGLVLYRPSCPRCSACEAIRVDARDFEPSSAQRRALRRGHDLLTVELGPVSVDAERLDLYRRHERERDLAVPESGEMSVQRYASFLGETCTESFELRLRLDGRLVAFTVVDRGRDSLSAVYCAWDPSLGRLSLGVYSILEQIDLCRRLGLRWLYLGLLVEQNSHLAYKASYRPHERLIDGRWRRFERG